MCPTAASLTLLLLPANANTGDEMHPTMHEMMLRANRPNLDRTMRTALLRLEPSSPAATAETVVLRLSTVWDEDSLARLAELEGRTTPAGPHVVAEVGGAVVAALPLGRGPRLGDPFRPTAHLAPLLQLRAKQLRAVTKRTRQEGESMYKTRGYPIDLRLRAAHRAQRGPSFRRLRRILLRLGSTR